MRITATTFNPKKKKTKPNPHINNVGIRTHPPLLLPPHRPNLAHAPIPMDPFTQSCLPLDNSRVADAIWNHLGHRVLKSFRRSYSFSGVSGSDQLGLEESTVSWHCSVFGGEEVVDVMEGRESSSSGCCPTSSCETTTTITSSSSEERGAIAHSGPAEPARVSSASDLASDEKKGHVNERELMEKQKPKVSEMEMMKERFAKLLLGEDMSGCGKGVSTALAISNAITNLCATVFGQIWRLEPLRIEKKTMWRREIEWLLCVSDHIIELAPSWQTFPDGSKLEVMTCRPRSDLYINLPALRKLDNMLLEILDGFGDTEFWYVDQGIVAPDSDVSEPFRKPLHRQEEKWWLPIPQVPPGGLQEKSRKQLQHKRECTNQILKAVMAINANVLVEMEVPDAYLESLPKNGKASLGDVIHRYITSDQFSPDCLLDFLDLSTEHQVLEIANRVEAAVFTWRRRATAKPASNTNRTNTRTSWGMVKELILDADKRELLADRAQTLLICLKQRFPGLTQTTLDMSKIQHNKDVGKSILESYSRVLESLAFNIIARIDDLLYVDDLTKHSDKLSSVSTVNVIAHKRVSIPYSVPVSSTPYATAYDTPSFSPAARVDRSPLINNNRMPHNGRGFGVKKALTDYLGVDVKGKKDGNNFLESSEAIMISKACRSWSEAI